MFLTKRTRHRISACALALLCALTALAQARVELPAEVYPGDAIASELEQTLQSLTRVSGEKPVNLAALLTFYQDRDYRPVWCSAGGISSAAQGWLSILGRVEQHGVSGLLMHRAQIQQRLDAEGPAELAELDLMLTDSFFQYARMMGRGQLDSTLADPHWHIPQPDPIPVYLLYQTAWVGEGGILHFRNDIYGHDRRLAAALRRETAPEKGDIWAGKLSLGGLVGFLQ